MILLGVEEAWEEDNQEIILIPSNVLDSSWTQSYKNHEEHTLRISSGVIIGAEQTFGPKPEE